MPVWYHFHHVKLETDANGIFLVTLNDSPVKTENIFVGTLERQAVCNANRWMVAVDVYLLKYLPVLLFTRMLMSSQIFFNYIKPQHTSKKEEVCSTGDLDRRQYCLHTESALPRRPVLCLSLLPGNAVKTSSCSAGCCDFQLSKLCCREFHSSDSDVISRLLASQSMGADVISPLTPD